MLNYKQKISILFLTVIFSLQSVAFASVSLFINALEENGEKFFLLQDHLDSTNSLVDETGAEVLYTEYLPFGGIKSETGIKDFRKKFTGKELDASTGLYDYGARQYDPSLGRFITPDTAEPSLQDPQSLNRYSYTLNNPLKYVDPTGNVAESPYDVASAMVSAAEFAQNPNLVTGALLAADLLAVATPGLPAPGLAVRALKGLNAAADASTAAKVGAKTSKLSKAADFAAQSSEKALKIHKNSNAYIGETHVYGIKGPRGDTFKIGESAQGVRKLDRQSVRAESQARKLTQQTGGGLFKSQIRKVFTNKSDARKYETKLIQRFRSRFGRDTLPGNKGNR